MHTQALSLDKTAVLSALPADPARDTVPGTPLIQPASAAASLLTGTVLDVRDQDEDNRVVRLQSRDRATACTSTWKASVAASCLLAPEIGDEVLFAPLDDGRAFVLAVLTRKATEAQLAFPHGVRVASPAPVRLQSSQTLELTAADTSLATGSLQVQAASAEATIASASLVTRMLRSFGERLEQTFARFAGRFGSAQRLISGDDETQAQNMRVCVQDCSLTQAGTVTQLAKDVVRIDAPQVHIS